MNMIDEPSKINKIINKIRTTLNKYQIKTHKKRKYVFKIFYKVYIIIVTSKNCLEYLNFSCNLVNIMALKFLKGNIQPLQYCTQRAITIREYFPRKQFFTFLFSKNFSEQKKPSLNFCVFSIFYCDILIANSLCTNTKYNCIDIGTDLERNR
jgi:hypothetical protein